VRSAESLVQLVKPNPSILLEALASRPLRQGQRLVQQRPVDIREATSEPRQSVLIRFCSRVCVSRRNLRINHSRAELDALIMTNELMDRMVTNGYS